MKRLLATLVAVAFVTAGASAFAEDKKPEGKSEKAATGAAKTEKSGGAQKSTTGADKSAQKKKKKESC